MEAGLPVEKAA